LLALSGHAAAAQTTAAAVEELVVTATRSGSPLQALPLSVSIAEEA
jgi:outer membrane receptor protein involved in Fe transport